MIDSRLLDKLNQWMEAQRERIGAAEDDRDAGLVDLQDKRLAKLLYYRDLLSGKPVFVPEQPQREAAGGMALDAGIAVDAVHQWRNEMAMKYHPDRGGDLRVMQAINHGHDQLVVMLGKCSDLEIVGRWAFGMLARYFDSEDALQAFTECCDRLYDLHQEAGRTA